MFEQFAEFARPVRKPVRAHIPTRTPRAQLAGRTHEQRQSREGGNFPIVSEPTIPDSETDENGQFPCGYCPESFPNQISRGAHRFRGHGVRKHPLKHSCKFCDFKAATPSRIAEHVAKEHPQEVLAEAG